MNFKTHTGETPSQDQFLAACKQVAEDYRENGNAILAENAFASHVTEEQRLAFVQLHNFDVADEVECGEITSMTTWQRVNEVLTGECVALLPKY